MAQSARLWFICFIILNVLWSVLTGGGTASSIGIVRTESEFYENLICRF